MPRREDLTDRSRLFSEALRRVRQDTRLRQIDVSMRSGLSKAMVSAYEGGKALPSLLSLWAYLDAIGRDLADLQEALDELGGLPKRRTADMEARERSVGRVVLKALRGWNDFQELGECEQERGGG
jgi:transcriptional regulator with XRE-family HTH domain